MSHSARMNKEAEQKLPRSIPPSNAALDFVVKHTQIHTSTNVNKSQLTLLFFEEKHYEGVCARD